MCRTHFRVGQERQPNHLFVGCSACVRDARSRSCVGRLDGRRPTVTGLPVYRADNAGQWSVQPRLIRHQSARQTGRPNTTGTSGVRRPIAVTGVGKVRANPLANRFGRAMAWRGDARGYGGKCACGESNEFAGLGQACRCTSFDNICFSGSGLGN